MSLESGYRILDLNSGVINGIMFSHSEMVYIFLCRILSADFSVEQTAVRVLRSAQQVSNEAITVCQNHFNDRLQCDD